jgi:hypothetical protein
MKTSLNEIKQIDDHITGQLSDGENLVIDARMIIDPVLRFNINLQRKLYALVKAYGRRSTRSEVVNVQDKLFQDTKFRNEILTIFSNP